jgi:hypothetical protein
VLFQQRFVPGIRSGQITLTFRRWKRPQAAAGRVQRSPAGRLEILDVSVVDVPSISAAEARLAGYPDRSTLLAGLTEGDGRQLYRVEFRHLDEPDPRDDLASADGLDDAEVAEIDRRLDRLDRASRRGAWTRRTLELIRDHPEERAVDLSARMGAERDPFKVDVRKLKNLGLTLSLERGYRLSPRGERYLARTRRI